MSKNTGIRENVGSAAVYSYKREKLTTLKQIWVVKSICMG